MRWTPLLQSLFFFFFFFLCWLQSFQVQASIFQKNLRLALCQARCSDDVKCCKECDSSTISNNATDIPYLQIRSNSNLTLQCKDVNRLVFKHEPGIYVIETFHELHNNWTSPTISKNRFYESTDLTPKYRYKYRIHKVTSQGIAQPETTKWFETHDETYTPKQVKDLLISTIEPDKNRKSQLQARLDITPADDLNCQYNVIYWGKEHDLYEYHLDATREYSMELHHLSYDKNFTVFIVSRNELALRQSKKVTLSFLTPSCLSVHRDLNICAPPAVNGLQVVYRLKKNLVDFNVEWKKPELEPDNYTIIVEPLNFENNSVTVSVLGNETMVEIPNLMLNRQYKIGVLAESGGGTSLEWKLIVMNDRTMASYQVVIAILTLATLLFAVVFGYIYINYKRYKGHSCHYNFIKTINRRACGFTDIKSPSKTLSPYETIESCSQMRDKFEIQVDRLSMKRTLGSGISGVVKLATLQANKKQTINVAVKMLRDDASSDDVQNFHREIMLMKSAGNHPNIVSIIGCCTLIKDPLLVVEYCSKGDLLTYLRTIFQEMMTAVFKKVDLPTESKTPLFIQRDGNLTLTVNNGLYDLQQEFEETKKIDTEDLLNFAWQVTSGMEFLSSNRIVHRDLAARNVLICADKTVKISDFGLSRDIYQENVYKKQSNSKLPIKWMAIEALTHQVYTTHSDVWSFGVLLYEIVTMGGTPYPGLHCSEILHFLKSGYRMERPSNCGFQLYELMRSCWHDNPHKRPTFYNLKQQLDKLLTTVTDNEYLNLSKLLQEPTIRHQYRSKHGRTNTNILSMPQII